MRCHVARPRECRRGRPETTARTSYEGPFLVKSGQREIAVNYYCGKVDRPRAGRIHLRAVAVDWYAAKMNDLTEKPRPTGREALLVRLKWTWICLTWYVLSIGPLYWSWYHAIVQGEPSLIEAFYRPLIYACEIPPIGSIVNAYINLWVL